MSSAGTKIDSPLKWHGGKHYLAPKLWEIAKAVPHVHRVEVFGGSLTFTLATEPEGFSEVVNDLNNELMTFWAVLQDEGAFRMMQRRLTFTPFSEAEWMGSRYISPQRDRDENFAAMYFIRCRQSMAGRLKNFAPLTKRRVRRGMNEQASAWLNAIEGLPEVHERLKRVVVRCKPFGKLIASEDSESTLFYLDPPYLHETRSTTTEYGLHEMSEAQHRELLEQLANIKGKFMLSGYDSTLYEGWRKLWNWNRHDFDLPNNSASGATKERKTECVWTNF